MAENDNPQPVDPKAPQAAGGDKDPNVGKDTSAAQPESVAPGQPAQDGVQVGGLKYTENEDGTRNYPEQKPVETEDDPRPNAPGTV